MNNHDQFQKSSNEKQCRVLVTGSLGYIGSRVCQYLVSNSHLYPHPHPSPLPEGEGTEVGTLPDGEGTEVGTLPEGEGTEVGTLPDGEGISVYGLVRDHKDSDAIKYIQGDFCDTARMRQVLDDIRPDTIIHCGGVTPHAGVSQDDFERVNHIGSADFLSCVEQYGGVKGFINASTLGVYGHPVHADGIVREGDKCLPLSPYGQSKYKFEQVLTSQTSVPYVNVRIANIPGRDAFINSVLRNHGVGFYGDKPYVRDYIHLDDLCRFFKASIDYINSGGQPCTLNAGSGVGYNFHQIVDEIERQLNTPITRNFLDAKSGDVLKIICDITSAKDRLCWLPKITELKDIVDYALLNKTL